MNQKPKLPCGHVDRREKYGEQRCRSCYDKEYYRTHPQRRLDSNARVRGWKESNPERYAQHRKNERDRSLQKKFGITLAQYEAMLQSQGGVCAICGRPPKNKALAVDHDHLTGRVRGLLCFLCNKFIVGMIERNRIDLAKVAAYLSKGGGANPIAT